jgi:hypothetical protein
MRTVVNLEELQRIVIRKGVNPLTALYAINNGTVENLKGTKK